MCFVWTTLDRVVLIFTTWSCIFDVIFYGQDPRCMSKGSSTKNCFHPVSYFLCLLNAIHLRLEIWCYLMCHKSNLKPKGTGLFSDIQARGSRTLTVNLVSPERLEIYDEILHTCSSTKFCLLWRHNFARNLKNKIWIFSFSWKVMPTKSWENSLKD